MEAKGSTFLKVTGILMIVFGAIALIVSIIAILGIAALAAFNDGTYDMTMLYVGGVFALISAVAEFVAGIIGVINAKLPHKANTCIVWGVVVAVMCIAGEIISMIGGSQLNVRQRLLRKLPKRRQRRQKPPQRQPPKQQKLRSEPL